MVLAGAGLHGNCLLRIFTKVFLEILNFLVISKIGVQFLSIFLLYKCLFSLRCFLPLSFFGKNTQIMLCLVEFSTL